MCWVIPPASPATTLADRIRSSSRVLPWSTWPMTVTTGGRGRSSSSVLLLVVLVEELGQQLGLTLLAGVDQADLGAELGGEQLDHVVGQRLGGRHHLPLQEQEADDVTGRPVELGTEVTGGRAALHDDLGVGHRCRRGRVGGHLGRLELFEVATTATGPALVGAPPSDAGTTAATRAAGSTAGAAARIGRRRSHRSIRRRDGSRSRHRNRRCPVHLCGRRPGRPAGARPPGVRRIRWGRRGRVPPGRGSTTAGSGRRRDGLSGDRARADRPAGGGIGRPDELVGGRVGADGAWPGGAADGAAGAGAGGGAGRRSHRCRGRGRGGRCRGGGRSGRGRGRTRAPSPVPRLPVPRPPRLRGPRRPGPPVPRERERRWRAGADRCRGRTGLGGAAAGATGPGADGVRRGWPSAVRTPVGS